MKNFWIALTLVLVCLVPSLCLAKMPDISSQTRSFNPLTGMYVLKGDVRVDFGNRVITADEAKGSLLTQVVDAKGHVHLEDVKYEITFSSDRTQVRAGEKIADCYDSCEFTCNGVTITADHGQYNWKTRLATFDGNVTVNGEKREGTVTFDVRSKQLQE